MVTSADSLFVARKRHIPTLAITSSIVFPFGASETLNSLSELSVMLEFIL